jgi:hypothetical protein
MDNVSNSFAKWEGRGLTAEVFVGHLWDVYTFYDGHYAGTEVGDVRCGRE